MREFFGRGITDGVCVGVAVIRRRTPVREESEAECFSATREWQRFLQARETEAARLERLYRDSVARLGKESAEIFATQAMMVRDADLEALVRQAIFTQQMRAGRGVASAGRQLERMFDAMENDYLRERVRDLRETVAQLQAQLRGGAEEGTAVLPDAPCVICADDLTPAQTATLDMERVVGLVTAQGSDTSHTAILARTLGLPTLVGVGEAALTALREGQTIALDAQKGRMYLDPDPQTLQYLRQKQNSTRMAQVTREAYRGRPTETASGRTVRLYANAGLPGDVDAVLAGDAEGIGLFRSEFLYLGRERAPDEQEQCAIYTEILRRMGGRRVIVRTLDIGADKQVGYLGEAKEQNPALGCRGVRYSLQHPQLFSVQARALWRAASAGRLSVMFPMIADESELSRVLALWEQAGRETASGAAVEVGVMIETPAAALISDRLARMVDFFSIGTNDLTQYTLAMDRQNAALQPFFKPHHRAILSLIRTTVQNAHAAGIWVGVCGELAADPALTRELLALGVDELSVAPGEVLALRERIASLK